MKSTLLLFISFFFTYSSIAQNSVSGLGIAYNYGAAAEDAQGNTIGGKSISVEVGSFNLEKSPLEFSMALNFGNGTDISFSWNIKTAFVFETFSYNFMKVGFGAGEMVSKNVLDQRGGLAGMFSRNDDAEKIFGRVVLSPFFEWEYEPTDGLSFFSRTNINYYGKSELSRTNYQHPETEVGLFYAGLITAVGVKFGF